MGYRDEAKFCMPGSTEPETDVRVVVQYVIQELQERFFSNVATSITMAPIHMTNALKDMGFDNQRDRIELLVYLQKTGLVKRISKQEGSLSFWYCSRITDVMSIPHEAFQAAWRELKAEEAVKLELEKLKKQLKRVQAQPVGSDEQFMAAIELRIIKAVEERDLAQGNVKKLEDHVASLRAELAERPDTSAVIIKEAFLERMDKITGQLRTFEKPTRRRS
jgi:hypothetical protein